MEPVSFTVGEMQSRIGRWRRRGREGRRMSEGRGQRSDAKDNRNWLRFSLDFHETCSRKIRRVSFFVSAPINATLSLPKRFLWSADGRCWNGNYVVDRTRRYVECRSAIITTALSYLLALMTRKIVARSSARGFRSIDFTWGVFSFLLRLAISGNTDVSSGGFCRDYEIWIVSGTCNYLASGQPLLKFSFFDS